MQIPGRGSRHTLLRSWALLALFAALPAGSGTAGEVFLERPDGEVLRFEAAGFTTRDPREHGASLVRFGVQAAGAGWQPELEVESVDGLRVRGRLLGGEGEELFLELVGGSRLPLSIEEVRRVDFHGRIPASFTGRIERAESGDRVYFARGAGLDRVDGTLLEFDGEGLKVDSALGPFPVRWRDVAVILVAPLDEGPAKPDPDAVPIVVDLVDGSRLRGALVSLRGDELGLRTPSGRGVRLPASAVAEVLVDDGRLAFLSDLTPIAAEEGSPFGDELGMTWPHRRDRSVSGGPLTAGGRRWSRGLGVHAPSRLTYALGGEWSRLRVTVAIDDEVLRLPARGSVRFRVLVDGEERHASRIVRGGEPPLELPPIDLAGARELVLEVDMADELHVADRADWLRPILVR